MKFLIFLLSAGLFLPVFVQDAEAGRRHRVVYRSYPVPVYSTRYRHTPRYVAPVRYYSHRPVLTAAAIASRAAYGRSSYYRFGYPYYARPSIRIVRRF